MTDFIVSFAWLYLLAAGACLIGLLVVALFFMVRDWWWDRGLCQRAEQIRLLEGSWSLPAREPRVR